MNNLDTIQLFNLVRKEPLLGKVELRQVESELTSARELFNNETLPGNTSNLAKIICLVATENNITL